MAKAAELDIDLAATEPLRTPAATSPRSLKARRAEPDAPKMDTPVNFRWPASEVKRMKRAALDADMTMQDYLLTCFHAFLKDSK